MGFLSWLIPGNDHELARTQYADRESASGQAARKERAARSRSATKAYRKGQKWEARDRRAHRTW